MIRIIYVVAYLTYNQASVAASAATASAAAALCVTTYSTIKWNSYKYNSLT